MSNSKTKLRKNFKNRVIAFITAVLMFVSMLSLTTLVAADEGDYVPSDLALEYVPETEQESEQDTDIPEEVVDGDDYVEETDVEYADYDADEASYDDYYYYEYDYEDEYEDEEEYILLGDVNNDGVVDSADVELLARYIGNIYPLPAIDIEAADFNQDGVVDSDDLSALIRYVYNIGQGISRASLGRTGGGLVGPEAIWHLSHETILPGATYVDVRLYLHQNPTVSTNPLGGIDISFIRFAYDPTVLSISSAEFAPRVEYFDFDLLDDAEQASFDATVAAFMGFPFFMTYEAANAQAKDQAMFSHAWIRSNVPNHEGFNVAIHLSGETVGDGGHILGPNIVQVFFSSAANHNPHGHPYVYIRFEVAADFNKVGDYTLLTMPPPGVVQDMAGGITVLSRNGSVTIEGFDILYNANPQSGGTVSNLPANQVGLSPGTHATRTGVPGHTNVDRNGTDTVVLFVGWSLEPITHILEYDDINYLTQRVISVTIDDADVPVFAIWGVDRTGNGIPDVLEDAYGILYNPNAQGGTVLNMPAMRVPLTLGTHDLSTTPVPTHTNVFVDGESTTVLFVGWSLTQTNRIFAAGEYNLLPTRVTEATIDDADVTVYAIWSFDKNNEGTPDVLEDTFEIHYAANGGIGTMPSQAFRLDGRTYNLSANTFIHANVNDIPVLFVGWSLAPIATILEHNDQNYLTQVLTSVTINEADVIVYAVWGFNRNNSCTPDVLEDTFEIHYKANGGTGTMAPQTFLLEGRKYTLSANAFTHANVGSVPVLFVGWSLNPVTRILEAADVAYRAQLITTATIPVPGAHVTVYAVWSFDRNNSGTPDVLDDTFEIHYASNGGVGRTPSQRFRLDGRTYTLSKSLFTHANVDGVSVLFAGWSAAPVTRILEAADVAHRAQLITEATIANADVTVYAVWSFDRNNSGTPDVLEDTFEIHYAPNGGTGTMPSQTDRLPGSHLLSVSTFTHANVDGQSVLFVGWSLAPMAKILEYDDQSYLAQRIANVTIVDSDVTVYAIWGFDKNNSGTPDVLEDIFKIHYVSNGGIGTTPSQEFRLNGRTYTLSTNLFTHANVGGASVLFAGWSAEPVGRILEASDVDYRAQFVTEVTIANADVTVYAVWSLDRNNSGTPDVLEDTFEIHYAANGGTGTMPSQAFRLDGRTYGLSVNTFTHASVDDIPVLFVGWSLEPIAKILEYNDQSYLTQRITSVTIDDADVMVYAIWGFDRTGTSVPDVSVLSIFYNGNAQGGGTVANVPATQVPLSPGTHALTMTPVPTHTDIDGESVLFVGWSLEPIIRILEPWDTPYLVRRVTSVTIDNADVTVYAIWGFDRRGTGVPDLLPPDYTVHGEYDQDGELQVTVNLPPGNYDVVVDGNTVVVTIPDANQENVTYSFPPGWIVTRTQDGPNVIIVATPPADSGYELEQCPEDGTTYVYVTVTFDAGAHGTFDGLVDYTELRVRKDTVLTSAQVPTPTSTTHNFIGWTSTVANVTVPVGHQVLREITFTAQWELIPDPGDDYRHLRIYYYVDNGDSGLVRNIENNASGRSYFVPVGSTFSTSNAVDRNDLDSENVYVFAGWEVHVNGILRMYYIVDKDADELHGSFTVPGSNEVPSPLVAMAYDLVALNADVVGGTIQLVAVWDIYEAEEKAPPAVPSVPSAPEAPTPPKKLPQTGVEGNILLWVSLLAATLLIGGTTLTGILKNKRDEEETYDNIDW